MEEKEIIEIDEKEHDHEHVHEHDHEHEHEHEHHHEHEHEHDEHEEHDHEHEHHHDHDHDHHDHDHEDHEHEHKVVSKHKHPKEYIESEHEHHHHHDHDHEHDDHDHDHDEHDHDHGTQYEVPGYDLLETHDHEGATVCSFERKTNMAPEEVRAAFEESMREIEDWLNGQGAIIGHVKGYVRELGATVTFSTVGAELNMTEIPGGGALLGFASIVFGPSQEELKDKVVEIFSRIR